ncbi:hypothetical protein Clacol_005585 [Clathrus columnatus]|uniref:Ubiquinol-cytochrome C reductase hinge domain-containing protein n=1 Tax=Clathrus columnatus TaxID=1419009 RepID=A0AAV5AFC6_9AGAM|nr:hypothetical protein Clacol_005585 [Clathrus columnatus]
MLSGLLSSFFVYADAKQDDSKEEENVNSSGKPEEEQSKETSEETPEEAPVEEAAKEEEEDEDEPEDVHPAIREECSNSAKCSSLKKHFDHCQEKVQGGHGFKGEECVEEL